MCFCSIFNTNLPFCLIFSVFLRYIKYYGVNYQFFSDEGLTKLWHERVEKGENIIEVLKQMTDEIENEDDRTLAKDKLYYCKRFIKIES